MFEVLKMTWNLTIRSSPENTDSVMGVFVIFVCCMPVKHQFLIEKVIYMVSAK